MLEEGKCVSDTFLPEGEAPALLVLSLHPLPWMRAPDLGQHLLSDPASAFKQSTFRRRPVYTDSITIKAQMTSVILTCSTDLGLLLNLSAASANNSACR